ncbi:MAG: hypothetical protein ACUVXA_20720 [Candidatus Jordarchaeum sp.]|uniref:hypothetical protein n=1 Tax=Candidatus Jordarchaeum sp. TaxID=2823881 RepID=UPI0040494398
MKYIKVAIPDDLEEKVRSKAGVLYGARKGSLSRSVTDALFNWLCPDPEMYIGTTPNGMSFEVPEKLIPGLMEILIDILKPSNVIYSYLHGEEEVELNLLAEEAKSKIREMTDILLNPTFMAELETASLYTGGGGCFLLEANLNKKQRIFIAERLLKQEGIEIQLTKEQFSIIVREGHVEVLY